VGGGAGGVSCELSGTICPFAHIHSLSLCALCLACCGVNVELFELQFICLSLFYSFIDFRKMALKLN
jgi:hypothetical protein